MIIKCMLLGFIGLSAGFLVAGGMFAFITMIGVVQRMATGSQTAKNIRMYEDLVVIAIAIGNLIFLYEWKLPNSYTLLSLFGVFSGMYVGCLSFALAETLNVFPVLSKRIKLKRGLKYIVLIFAIGKCFGSFYQFVN